MPIENQGDRTLENLGHLTPFCWPPLSRPARSSAVAGGGLSDPSRTGLHRRAATRDCQCHGNHSPATKAIWRAPGVFKDDMQSRQACPWEAGGGAVPDRRLCGCRSAAAVHARRHLPQRSCPGCCWPPPPCSPSALALRNTGCGQEFRSCPPHRWPRPLQAAC